MHYSHVEDDASHVLSLANLSIPQGSPRYLAFRQMLLRARIEAAKRWVEHDEGVFGGQPSDKFFDVAAVNLVSATKPKATSTTLLTLYERYANARTPAINVNTVDERHKTVIRFSQFVGLSRQPNDIAGLEARTWRDHLLEWPQYADQAKEFNGQDFLAVLRTNRQIGREPILRATANKYITDMSSFYQWLVGAFSPPHFTALYGQ